MKSMRSAQPPPFQAYLLYQNRFIAAGQLCSAWEHFGGFAAQMDAQAVMLTLAVTDNVGVAIAYDLQTRNHIAHLARQRRADIDFAHLLPKENEDIKRQVLPQRAPKTLNTEKGPEKKGKGKGGNLSDLTRNHGRSDMGRIMTIKNAQTKPPPITGMGLKTDTIIGIGTRMEAQRIGGGRRNGTPTTRRGRKIRINLAHLRSPNL